MEHLSVRNCRARGQEAREHGHLHHHDLFPQASACLMLALCTSEPKDTVWVRPRFVIRAEKYLQILLFMPPSPLGVIVSSNAIPYGPRWSTCSMSYLQRDTNSYTPSSALSQDGPGHAPWSMLALPSTLLLWWYSEHELSFATHGSSGETAR